MYNMIRPMRIFLLLFILMSGISCTCSTTSSCDEYTDESVRSYVESFVYNDSPQIEKVCFPLVCVSEDQYGFTKISYISRSEWEDILFLRDNLTVDIKRIDNGVVECSLGYIDTAIQIILIFRKISDRYMLTSYIDNSM